MALEPGKNSYLTLQQANEYVGTFYACTDVQSAWTALSTAQQEAALIAACFDLQSLPFAGRAYRADQQLAFPRWPSDAVPYAIQAAQAEIALLPLQPDIIQMQAADASKRAALQKQGVKSFSLGDLSETYTGAVGMAGDYPFLLSSKISRLLSRYLNGGFATC